MFCTNVHHLAKQSLDLVFYVNKITISFCSLTEYSLAGKKEDVKEEMEKETSILTHTLCLLIVQCCYVSSFPHPGA